MDPSEEKKQDSTETAAKKSNLLPAILVVLLLVTIVGIGFYFYSGSRQVKPPVSETMPPANEMVASSDKEAKPAIAPPIPPVKAVSGEESIDLTAESTVAEDAMKQKGIVPATDTIVEPMQAPSPPKPAVKVTPKIESICDAPALGIDQFYKQLDTRSYMESFQLSSSGKEHFTALIEKLLSNPPQVTRESDDLYTILKNTAHFFRVSGKDNILMLKGILDHEKESVEKILADYFSLITTPECSTVPYAANIDHDALYEYACFFLNTMGGRLYLFRRDSKSRMVVTYYAIRLVDEANIQNNNRHGIALKPLISMLISEMESGGSTLKRGDTYLDILYDLKEKYQ